ncbi:MAG: ABC transporter permease [Pseudomonadota bacterium]
MTARISPFSKISPAWATVLFSCLVFGLPLLLLAAYSLGLVQILNGDPGPSLAGWQEFFASPYLGLYMRSLRVALFTAIVCTLFAYPVAYYLAAQPEERAQKLLILILLPFVTSFLLRVLSWRVILSDFGVIQSFAASLGLWPADEPMMALLYNYFAVTIILVYAWLPLAVLPIYASLSLTDVRLVEAAVDHGANRWTAFFTVTLPTSAPGVAAAFILVFVPVNGEYVAPILVGGANGVLFGNSVANMFGEGFDWSFAAVLASFLFLSVISLLAIIAFALWIVPKWRQRPVPGMVTA